MYQSWDSSRRESPLFNSSNHVTTKTSVIVQSTVSHQHKMSLVLSLHARVIVLDLTSLEYDKHRIGWPR